MKKAPSWNRTIWAMEIAQLPPNLSATEIAKKLGMQYAITLFWLKRFRYKIKDTRGKYKRPESKFLKRADWNLPNITLARRFKISRERVRQVRVMAGAPKVNGRK